MPPNHTHLLPNKQDLEKRRKKKSIKRGRGEGQNLFTEAAVWHGESLSKALYPYMFTCRHLSHTHKKSLVWFKALGLCCTTDGAPSLGFFLDSPLVPCVMEILLLWIHRTVSPCHPPTPTVLQQITDRVGQHIILVLGLGSCRVGKTARSLLSSLPGWARQHCPGSFTSCSNEQEAGPVL